MPKDNVIVEIHKHLKSWQTIEINPNGDIFICHKMKSGKKQKNKVANLYSNADNNYPYNGELFRTKSFVQINNPGLKRYNQFGKKLPKREIKKDYEKDLLLSIFMQFLDLKENRPGFYTNNDGLSYITYTVNDITAFFYHNTGTLRWLESNGKRYYISQKFPELETIIISKKEEK